MESNGGDLGRIYGWLREGKTSSTEIIEVGSAANSGAVFNLKKTINTAVPIAPLN